MSAGVADVDEQDFYMNAFWARYLGCSVDELRPESALVLRHSGPMRDLVDQGIFIFAAGGGPLVSLPPESYEKLTPQAERLSSNDIYDPDLLRSVFSALPVNRIVGPNFLGHADETMLSPKSGYPTRQLTNADNTALKVFQHAFTEPEWQDCGSEIEEGPVMGAFTDDGTLVSTAGYVAWANKLAHITVATHPEFRLKGFARAVTGALVRLALSNRLVPQYLALETNQPSIALARALGFVKF